jgi:translation initiation factor IF-2
MSDGSEQKEGTGRKPLTLTRTTSGGTVRQSFSHGRTKQVAVEVREKRSINRAGAGAQPGAPQPIRRNPRRPNPNRLSARKRAKSVGRWRGIPRGG